MFFTNKQKESMREWTKTIIYAIVIYLFLSIFIFSIKVDGSSMYPTFENGNLLISTRNYLHPKYERGDVVIFYAANVDRYLIKRVIGTPGDTVRIEDGKVYVNGQEIIETYINNPPLETLDVKVPNGTYFVMGDNRQDSLDSRYTIVGFVDKNDIKGEANIEIFPVPRVIN